MTNEQRTVWGHFGEDDKFEFVTITKDILKKALALCENSFCKEETVSVCTGTPDCQLAKEETTKLAEFAAWDGVSIAAIDKSNGNVVSAAFNKIQKNLESDEQHLFYVFANKCKATGSQEFIRFMYDVDSKMNLFSHYNTNCLMEIMYLMTDKAYRNQKLAEGVCAASLKLATAQANKELIVPEYEDVKIGAVTAMGTSNISQRVFKKLNFDQLLEIDYDMFETGSGVKYSEKTNQKSVNLVGKRILH